MKICNHCGRKLKIGETVLVINYDDYICDNCYEEYTLTFYRVGGEYVGDENDIGFEEIRE